MRKLVAAVTTAVMVVAFTAVSSAGAAWHLPWSAAWTTPLHPPSSLFWSWAPQGFDNHTLRQVVRAGTGGLGARVRFSNAHGTASLQMTGATVAFAATGAAVTPNTVHRLTFAGNDSVVVPVGGEVVSDPVPLWVPRLQALTVSTYFAGPTGPATNHLFANTMSYRAAGDHLADTDATAFTEASWSSYYVSGVEIIDATPQHDSVVVAFGDSITEGTGSTINANNRYPDALAERLTWPRGVVNAGLGGNRMLNDCFGTSGLTRFAHDALDLPDVRSVILLQGINDIGLGELNTIGCAVTPTRVTASDLIAGYQNMIGQARARGIRIIGGTLLPFKGAPYFNAYGESVRQAVNDWIRASGEFDAVVDFDQALRNTADPEALLPMYDSGDHLHPNDAGYQAMADAVDLGTL
ncbi:SGNH/GDSL hydrolase family protein [Lentzea sp. E54]|uniref:SGNH/GDSL hydrolase family protein n=1 Tax=Lentzea xerophila TaxID=3435883 RepID=UPI003DA52AA9